MICLFAVLITVSDAAWWSTSSNHSPRTPSRSWFSWRSSRNAPQSNWWSSRNVPQSSWWSPSSSPRSLPLNNGNSYGSTQQRSLPQTNGAMCRRPRRQSSWMGGWSRRLTPDTGCDAPTSPTSWAGGDAQEIRRHIKERKWGQGSCNLYDATRDAQVKNLQSTDTLAHDGKFLMLAMSWAPGYCYFRNKPDGDRQGCRMAMTTNGRVDYRLTIHGFWLASGMRGRELTCDDAKDLTQQEETSVRQQTGFKGQYWASYNRDDQGSDPMEHTQYLWYHEYDKHGKCFCWEASQYGTPRNNHLTYFAQAENYYQYLMEYEKLGLEELRETRPSAVRLDKLQRYFAGHNDKSIFYYAQFVCATTHNGRLKQVWIDGKEAFLLKEVRVCFDTNGNLSSCGKYPGNCYSSGRNPKTTLIALTSCTNSNKC